MGKYIYEVIDHTSAETYYPIGFWFSLNEAINKVLEHKDDPADLDQYGYSDSDYFKVVIWARKEGDVFVDGIEVAVFEWSAHYDESDEHVWVLGDWDIKEGWGDGC